MADYFSRMDYQVPSNQMNREDIPDEPRAYNRPLES